MFLRHPLFLLRLRYLDPLLRKRPYKILRLGQIAFRGRKINTRRLYSVAGGDRGHNLLAFFLF